MSEAANTQAAAPDFYEVGHTYVNVVADTDWKFRVDTITAHPENGERTALGWRHFRGDWEPYAYHEDDWDVALVGGIIDATTPRSDTFPAWLARRMDPRGPKWDAMSDDDRSYWEHEARAVQRAVARDGFKPEGGAS